MSLESTEPAGSWFDGLWKNIYFCCDLISCLLRKSYSFWFLQLFEQGLNINYTASPPFTERCPPMEFCGFSSRRKIDQINKQSIKHISLYKFKPNFNYILPNLIISIKLQNVSQFYTKFRKIASNNITRNESCATFIHNLLTSTE